MAIAAAVAAWLVANVAIAWSLRARPGLPWRHNVAFPEWALVAIVAAFMLSLTHAGATLGVEPLTPGALRITAAIAAVGVTIAAAGRVALSCPSASDRAANSLSAAPGPLLRYLASQRWSPIQPRVEHPALPGSRIAGEAD
jgi:hypothetical protein